MYKLSDYNWCSFRTAPRKRVYVAHAQFVSDGHSTRGRNNRLIEAPATFILCRRICSARVPTFPRLCNLIEAPSAPVIQHRCNRWDPRVTTSPLSLSLFPPPSFSLPEVWISREIKRRDKKRRRGEAEREREREGHAKHVGDPLEAPTWFRGILSAFCKQEDKGRRTGIKSAGVDTQPFWNCSRLEYALDVLACNQMYNVLAYYCV